MSEEAAMSNSESIPFANDNYDPWRPKPVEEEVSEPHDMDTSQLTEENPDADVIYLRNSMKLEKDYTNVLNHQIKLQRLTYTLASYIKQIKVNCPSHSKSHQQDLQSVKNQYICKLADCKNTYNDCMKQVEVSFNISIKYVKDRQAADRNPKHVVDEYYKNYFEYLNRAKQSTIQAIEHDYKVVRYHLKKIYDEKIQSIEFKINHVNSFS